ncbi:hypothetical protein POTOM_003268 [Populus tomentosa]|uniref:Ubiquitin thioesterase OTU n=1 Tax=Populus tomentosa TaxID=118781 RepID=A0A8X8DL08_POPTO|nr:hypothetical protein POTOM_003268 [Populus tomentosa]
MEGIILRRVIPSDNSCLFNAVGTIFCMESSPELLVSLPSVRADNRLPWLGTDIAGVAMWYPEVIAATVASDPEKYNEAFLGKPNGEYCTWIIDPEKWGGAIELSILADYYGREIAAYDIQTLRCDLYGQERTYSERAMLIYDGLHYDALAMSPFEGAPEEFDQTIFAVQNDRTIGPAEGHALNLVKEQQRRRSYTDTANFTLRCGVCQIGVIGQKLGAILLDFYILILIFIFIFMLIFRRLLNMRKPQAMRTFKNIDNRKQKLFISQGPW